MSSSLSSFFLSLVFIVLPRTVIIRAYIYISIHLSLSLSVIAAVFAAKRH